MLCLQCHLLLCLSRLPRPLQVKQLLKSVGASQTHVFAKIENLEVIAMPVEEDRNMLTALGIYLRVHLVGVSD